MKMDRTQMSLQLLRKDFPEWSWRATRAGMGWRYEGHLGELRATITAMFSLHDDEEHSRTSWIVYETREPYASWRYREAARLKAEGLR